MTRLSLFFVFFLTINSLLAQILDQEVEIFNGEPFFNREWIKSHRIHKITGVISIKRDNLPIQRTSERIEYFFNTDGSLHKKIRTKHVRNRIDTAEILFEYNVDGRLLKKIEKDHYGYFAHISEYNSYGLLISVRHSRMNREQTGSFYETEVIWQDSVVPEMENKDVIRYNYFNSVGKPYKVKVIRKDENGLITMKREYYLVGGGFEQLNYVRNELGDIISIEKSSDKSTDITKLKRSFDNEGKTYKEEVYTGNELTGLRHLEYDAEGNITLHLYRNISKGMMWIIELEYEYF